MTSGRSSTRERPSTRPLRGSSLEEPDTSRSSDGNGIETRDLGPSGSFASGVSLEDELGPRIGRYLIIDELGHGGMGRVMRAYDPKLQREVALKVLHTDTMIPMGRDRMVREARTMAQLSHPNVVAVYDVEDDAQHGLVLAMELVKGSSLKQWLRASPRSWRAILAAFLEAGQGLAAAHDAGLLHRDFKPANVLVAGDGPEAAGERRTLKVVDFGLAKQERDREGSSDVHMPIDLATHDLTQAGAVLGTPRYMAPEQHRSEVLTSAADQYAFCVALWEALVGPPPFADPEPLPAKLAGPPPWPRPPAVPRAVGEVLRRGLAPRPEDRWPGMRALMDALAAAGRPGRWVPVLGAAGAVALALVAWQAEAFFERQRAQERMDRCTSAAAAIDETWNDDARARVRAGLLATRVSHAEAKAESVMPWLDRHAEEWRSATHEACLDASVRGTWDADTLDRAQWCLEERRLELGSLVEQLAGADAETAATAFDAAAALGAVSPCRDRALLASLPAPPPLADRPAVEDVRASLARARALQAAGASGRALEVVQAARQQADAVAWLPLRARALVLEATLLDASGQYARAERSSIAAFERALEASAWNVAHDAALLLVYVVGAYQARPAEGRTWAGLAEASATHMSDPLGALEASRASALATLAAGLGEYTEAARLFERVLALEEASRDPEHPKVAEALSNLATLYIAVQDYDKAVPMLERALAQSERIREPEHPFIVFLLSSLAVSHDGLGAHARANALYERALSLQEQALGPTHPDLATTLINYSSTLDGLGEHDRALAVLERALAIRTAAFPADHPQVAEALNNLGLLYRDRGDPARARPLLERAAEVFEASLGPDHAHTAVALANVATVIEDPVRARSLLERAVAIHEKAFDPRHPSLSGPLLDLAKVLVATEPELAIDHAERALAILEEAATSPTDRALARRDLAELLWSAPEGRGRDRDRALLLMRAAREALRTNEGSEGEIAEVEAWLAAHAEGSTP